MENRIDVQPVQEAVNKTKAAIGQVLIGQEKLVNWLIKAILADGHVLIEGVPGIAKTLAAKLMAHCINVPFSRIQFTPDLMPSDILGTNVFNPQSGNFQYKNGPIFSNIVLIDEINRSPAKTQAALFEVMEEKQVTSDGNRFLMPEPFMVLATQNPVEQEGTYRLPEAQLDRFLFKIEMTYPSLAEEVQIIEQSNKGVTAHFANIVQPVIEAADIVTYRQIVNSVFIEEKVMQFIAELVHQTRNNPYLFLGASPRASVAILKTAKATAAMAGRDFVTPDDVVSVLYPVLCHRIMLTPEKEMEGITVAEVIASIIKKVAVPR